LTIPVFEDFQNGFRVTVFNESLLNKDNVTEDVTEDVTDNRRNAIVELIKKDNKITTIEIANTMGVVRRTIARDIELLKRSGVIVRIGSDKHGFWEVVNRKNPEN
jgi:ATP-dependent DNA helicase RecG